MFTKKHYTARLPEKEEDRQRRDTHHTIRVYKIQVCLYRCGLFDVLFVVLTVSGGRRPVPFGGAGATVF
jgi:hypothetical protein